jgi:hypothetical protein
VHGQVEDVVDLLEEQPLVLQRAEPALAGAVLARVLTRVRTWRSSGWVAMNPSNTSNRNVALSDRY